MTFTGSTTTGHAIMAASETCKRVFLELGGKSAAILLDDADSPFGGYQQSGIGREMGAAGLEEFLGRKTFASVIK